MWEECCEGDEGGVSTCRATRKRFKCLGSTHSKAHGLLYHQNPSPHPRDREWAFNRYNGSVDAYEKALLDIESKEDHAQNAVRTRVDTYLAMLAKHFNAKGKLHPHDASLQHIVAREVRAERQAYDEEVYSRFNKAFKDIIKTITKRHKEAVGRCVSCGKRPDELEALAHSSPIRLESAHVYNRSEMERSIETSVEGLNLGWRYSVHLTRMRLLNRHLCLNPEANGLYQGPACVCLCTICHGLKDGRTPKYLFGPGVYDRFICSVSQPSKNNRCLPEAVHQK